MYFTYLQWFRKAYDVIPKLLIQVIKLQKLQLQNFYFYYFFPPSEPVIIFVVYGVRHYSDWKCESFDRQRVCGHICLLYLCANRWKSSGLTRGTSARLHKVYLLMLSASWNLTSHRAKMTSGENIFLCRPPPAPRPTLYFPLQMLIRLFV